MVPKKRPPANAPTFLSLLLSALLPSPSGPYVAAIASGLVARNGKQGTWEHIVSVLDTRSMSVVTTIRQEGTFEYFVTADGRLATEEVSNQGRSPTVPGRGQRDTVLRFFTFPDLTADGACEFRETLRGRSWFVSDGDCGPTLQEILDGLYPAHDRGLLGPPCRSMGALGGGRYCVEDRSNLHRNFWGSPVVTDAHIDIYGVKTGALVGTLKETTHDSVKSRLASFGGHDYLLIMEGGTKLKIYEITEPAPGTSSGRQPGR
jgi:hypothetical protein